MVLKRPVREADHLHLEPRLRMPGALPPSLRIFTSRTLTLRLLIYIYIYMEHPFLMFLDHTKRRTTVGRTPLDE